MVTKNNKKGTFKSHVGNILNEARIRIHNLSPKLAISIISIVIAILIIEVILRLTSEKTYGLDKCQSLDEEFHHVMIPNRQCRFKTDEWDVVYKINSMSLRDMEYTLNKPEGIFRILVLGDSFAQVHGVDIDESFPKLLERRLNFQDNANIEIINSGVFAYSPLVEYLFLKKKGVLFEPDLVIIAFTPTDFWEDRQRFKELELSYPGSSAEEIEEKIFDGSAKFKFENINSINTKSARPKSLLPFLPFRVKSWLKENLRVYSKLVNFIKAGNSPVQQNVLHLGDIDKDIMAIQRGDKISDEDWEKLWILPVKYLGMMKKILDEQKVPMVVVIIPDPAQISDREWPGRKLLGYPEHFVDTRTPFEEELTRRLKALDISSINLLPDFKKSSIFPLYFDNDGHWRESGHKVATEIIYEGLTRMGILVNKF